MAFSAQNTHGYGSGSPASALMLSLILDWTSLLIYKGKNERRTSSQTMILVEIESGLLQPTEVEDQECNVMEVYNM